MGIAARIEHDTRTGGVAERVDRALQHVETTHREWRTNTLAGLLKTVAKAGDREAVEGGRAIVRIWSRPQF
jgi:hypothetical protein